MIRPSRWYFKRDWLFVYCEQPDDVNVEAVPTLRFRKSAICTYTSGQLVIRSVRKIEPTFSTGDFKAKISLINGEDYEFAFSSRVRFMSFINDLDDALQP